VSGSPQAKPLILLHSGGGNSTMWLYNVAALSTAFCVDAIDIIGEAGKSAGTRPLYKSDDHARWLNEVLHGLGIEKAAVCGASLGGMIAHMFASQYPQSVTELVLLAPPSLTKMRPMFLLRAILANFFPTAYFAKKFLGYISSSAKNLPQSAVEACSPASILQT
jgi:pimeloyl-ACP methyl ester carboxylesterase